MTTTKRAEWVTAARTFACELTQASWREVLDEGQGARIVQKAAEMADTLVKLAAKRFDRKPARRGAR